jgi:pyridoxamine 5'-phosphate oxidase-like protein
MSIAAAPSAPTTTELAWRALRRASFAVVSHVTPDGRPRSSGVLYALAGRRLYVVVGEDSWKARHLAAGGEVAVTVPVRRGGPLALLVPIPPATVSFHGSATVHPSSWLDEHPVPPELARLLPAERRAGSAVVEIEPRGAFVTYGIGVPLLRMRDPARSRARVPVG